MEKSIAVANYFVEKALDSNVELTPMKLVKLVYIAHGWHLALNDTELFSEDVQAWQYGPVVPTVYYNFRHFGSGIITSKAEIQDVVYSDGGLRFKTHQPQIQDASVIPLLDRVWQVYSKYTGAQLSTLTHQKGTPWDITYNKLGGKDKKSFPIPTDLIKSHYKTLANAT